jgi:hypothetical protein
MRKFSSIEGQSTCQVEPPPMLVDILDRSLWCKNNWPFPHITASNVFKPEFYVSLERALFELLDRGLSKDPAQDRLSMNMLYSDAYSWNLPPNIGPPLNLFYSKVWHDLLTGLAEVQTTLDVNAAIHHHQIGSSDGHIHQDLSIAYFSNQPRSDMINPMDLSRCSYTTGKTYQSRVEVHKVVRSVTMIFYLGNPEWKVGQGAETALYESANQDVRNPSKLVPPIDNSFLLFNNTPKSFHAFLSNSKMRNSIILWLHRPLDESVRLFGAHNIRNW